MAKLGVGVGEEFPVDEKQPEGAPGAREANEGSSGSDEARRCREDWRAERDAIRAEWRPRKRIFRDEMRRRMRGRFGNHPYTYHYGAVLRLFAVVAVAALLFALLPHLLTFLAIAVLLTFVFFIAHRGYHFHHHYNDAHPDADA